MDHRLVDVRLPTLTHLFSKGVRSRRSLSMLLCLTHSCFRLYPQSHKETPMHRLTLTFLLLPTSHPLQGPHKTRMLQSLRVMSAQQVAVITHGERARISERQLGPRFSPASKDPLGLVVGPVIEVVKSRHPHRRCEWSPTANAIQAKPQRDQTMEKIRAGRSESVGVTEPA